MSIPAGERTHRITVKRTLDSSESSQNSYGEDSGSPATVGSFWVRIRPTLGREFAAMLQKWAEAKYAIDLDKQPGVTFTRKMFIEWNDRTLDILDVQDVGGSSDPGVLMICRDHDG